jgi:hypothetical protein
VKTQVTNGGGGMPAFGGTLSAAEIQAVADYVASRREGRGRRGRADTRAVATAHPPVVPGKGRAGRRVRRLRREARLPYGRPR